MYDWSYSGDYILGIYRDDDGVTWRREKDDSVFPITSADWYPGFPDPAAEIDRLHVFYDSSDPHHGKFKNLEVTTNTLRLFICEKFR